MSLRPQNTARTRRLAAASGSRHGLSIAASPLTVLLLCVLVGIGVGALRNRLARAGGIDPVLSVPATLAFPFQYGMTKMEGGVIFGWDALFSGKTLASENVRLTAENARLKLEVERLRSKADEAGRLRTALDFVEAQEKKPVAAPVIGWLPSPHIESVTLGCGARNGVRAQSVARTPDGLIGQIFDATPLTCQVMLLTDTESRVGGMIYRDGKAREITGIVQGGGREQPLTMLYLRRDADIKKGDTVRTSGYGGVFPPDIPIGTIISVADDKPRSLKLARIQPAAPMPGTLREAIVLP